MGKCLGNLLQFAILFVFTKYGEVGFLFKCTPEQGCMRLISKRSFLKANYESNRKYVLKINKECVYNCAVLRSSLLKFNLKNRDIQINERIWEAEDR
jgi:hypothetical protein